jgi:hypothetical protein
MCMRNVGVGDKRPGNGQGFHLPLQHYDHLSIKNEQAILKPEKAVEILQKHGLEVTTEQAGLILEFLRKLADIAVTQYLRKWK